MPAPLISVIIPAFNYAHFIEETLQSVIDQSYPNWEVWVIDDGSTDTTKETVQKIAQKEARIQYFYQENKGLPAARNQGYRFSRGEYIQFLDADDLIHRNKFCEQIEILESDSTIDVCYTNFRWFRDRLDNLTPRYDVNLKLGENPFEDFLLRWDNGLTIPIHAAIFRKSVWQDAPPFNEQLRAKEDWFMWCMLAQNSAKFFFYDQDYAYYRIHRDSMCADLINMTSYFVKSTYYLAEIVPTNLKENFYRANQLRLDRLINAILLQNNRENGRVLAEREAQLAAIYTSRAWKVSMWLRQTRSLVVPAGSIRSKISRIMFSAFKKITKRSE